MLICYCKGNLWKVIKHKILGNKTVRKYRMIKKSLCTWRLQYKNTSNIREQDSEEIQDDQEISVHLAITVKKTRTIDLYG
jgi:hypothetical protein